MYIGGLYRALVDLENAVGRNTISKLFFDNDLALSFRFKMINKFVSFFSVFFLFF